MLLSILIPTYNRSNFLIKNLTLMWEYFSRLEIKDQLEIVVSNNNSSDDTDLKIKALMSGNSNFNIRYYTQSKNIGPEKNSLFVLDKSNGEYVMFLGDDDYLDFNYLLKVLDCLKLNSKITSIIPNFVQIDMEGNLLSIGRDYGLKSKIYYRGFNNCLINSWRGHQLSGLVLKKDFLYQEYIENKVSNMYPFIFFLGLSCLKGNSLHLTDFPVKVTQPGQQNKDWGYGKDGLINEIFDNYNKLPVNYFKKSLLQLYFFNKQNWRLFMYKSNGFQSLINPFFRILLSDNSTFIFKILFPFLVFLIIIRLKIKSTISRL